MKKPDRIIVGITGASGAIYGITLLKALRAAQIHTHLIMSKNASITIKLETGLSPDDVAQLADVTHPFKDVSACISSGSYRTSGMIIAPCTIRTMAEIATCTSSSLLTRAADVILKEQRKLVLMVRETPLHAGHLEQMHKLALMGAIIAPPVPAFYNQPETLQDIVDHTCARTLDLFDIESPILHLKRWEKPA
jgi:flavin prenyltransferase